MRIALVAAGGFDRSGRERIIPSLVWLVERLARRHEVFVYVVRYHDAPCRYKLAGATVCDLGRPRTFLQQHAALTRAMRADGPFDIVHGYWPQPAGLLAVSAGIRLGVPRIVTFDSGEFVSLPGIGYGQQGSWRGRLGVRLAGRLATRATVCSEFQATLARQHGLEAEIVPLGVDTTLFTVRERPADGPPFRLLHVASLNPVKDQGTLLQAVHLLRLRSLDVRLDLAGEDTMHGKLQARVHELGLDEAVTFHGFRSVDALVPLYHRAHLFVLTSLHEAAGVVLLEAACTGLAIVGSAVGYLADWSPDRALGVPPGDPAALAAAIEALLRDPKRRHDMALAATDWARAHDADWTAGAFEALYCDVIATYRGGRRRQASS